MVVELGTRIPSRVLVLIPVFVLALSVAPFFRINAQKAKDILQLVKNTTAKWREIAAGFRISRKEMDEMEGVFIHFV
ncbi:MAG: hypothetical protein FWC26_04975 [Fibromonadales bacterium]|nr:hypothetical protein [Fibromonadales bacterium]